ncbi:tRNA epoxyqueuosine(34) reductase QueG [Ignatzschineria cameli]|uniref:tRNA epoxyqueuosine(34) reductase QueG n=1 Tax=Ignatzschineria cameli TaxID=2182793 RepID=A0ABX5KY38_9GAMM|nr:tRNA epoxyqueuosine(34) reductase QueG [Ignatzschineria cameli]PWD88629.1 tRNA epoxyqueuosine(34) reductase QueG [Ignatzschineria cameli]PWD88791.1 tRNA epoxyqueuosine(34) reductase QueG [Ignatzschineria cameli]PWD90193.1 tRNA epoxyqueuosine(34) reductase QueG [Ignatzschineria cameli]
MLFHCDLDYICKHGEKRCHPNLLVPGTISILTVQLHYFNPEIDAKARLEDPNHAYVAEYALGRDYHKVLRNILTKLGKWLQEEIPGLEFRAFVDSAPVLERAFSQKSGLGFFGKNTMIIHPKRGSFFFLGELLLSKRIDIPSEPITNHCGQCTRCIKACPTDAIVFPFKIDARKCISYLTIEHFGPIPEEYRTAMGNRIFGCDDCQIVCPWNRFAIDLTTQDFFPLHRLDSSTLLELFSWTEAEFLRKTEGSPIRRLGYARWLRNIAIGIGNSPYSEENIAALKAKENFEDEAVREHVKWALERQCSI